MLKLMPTAYHIFLFLCAQSWYQLILGEIVPFLLRPLLALFIAGICKQSPFEGSICRNEEWDID